MSDEPTNARKSFGAIAPKLAEITDKVLFGDVWADPVLSPRDRSLVTITSLISLYRTNGLPFHIKRPLENGVTKEFWAIFHILTDELVSLHRRAGNVWENAAMESFFSSLTERIGKKVYRSRDDARADVFDYIERFYNTVRRHSTIGYVSPVDFERKVGLA